MPASGRTAKFMKLLYFPGLSKRPFIVTTLLGRGWWSPSWAGGASRSCCRRGFGAGSPGSSPGARGRCSARTMVGGSRCGRSRRGWGTGWMRRGSRRRPRSIRFGTRPERGSAATGTIIWLRALSIAGMSARPRGLRGWPRRAGEGCSSQQRRHSLSPATLGVTHDGRVGSTDRGERK